MSACVIIGIGNILMSDDGVGIHAVRYLEGKLPQDVPLIEGGVYGLDLLGCMESSDRVIFIDGIDAGDEPGAVFRFSPSQVKRSQDAPAISQHDLGLYELIDAARLLEQCPEDIILIAVQVKSMETGMKLSPEVEGALPHVHRLVMEELSGR